MFIIVCRWIKITPGGLASLLTRSTPHLGQVAVCLPRLLAQLHHIPAQRLRGNSNLSKMLVIVTEVYCQKHLGTAKGTERGTDKDKHKIEDPAGLCESRVNIMSHCNWWLISLWFSVCVHVCVCYNWPLVCKRERGQT